MCEPIAFYLPALNLDFTMRVPGRMSASCYLPVPPTDAVVKFSIPAPCFWWAGDSEDLNDVDSTDLRYYTQAWSPGGNIALRTVTEWRVHVQGRNHSSVAQDFVAYLAQSIFGDANMADLFSNETALRQSIEAAGATEAARIAAFLTSIDVAQGTHPDLQTDASGCKYFTNAVDCGANVARTILETIVHQNPVRLGPGCDGDDSDSDSEPNEKRKIPLIPGDTLNFVLTLRPSPTQPLRSCRGPVPPRTYLVCMRI